jgi:hypothetical protein
MTPKTLFASGLALALVSLWGGAYAYHALADTWMHGPAEVTAVVLGIFGIFLACFGICGIVAEDLP